MGGTSSCDKSGNTAVLWIMQSRTAVLRKTSWPDMKCLPLLRTEWFVSKADHLGSDPPIFWDENKDHVEQTMSVVK
jgi:hypothetical protein